jgi:hypothetical protein
MLVGSYDRALTYLEAAVDATDRDPVGRERALAYEAPDAYVWPPWVHHVAMDDSAVPSEPGTL